MRAWQELSQSFEKLFLSLVGQLDKVEAVVEAREMTPSRAAQVIVQ